MKKINGKTKVILLILTLCVVAASLILYLINQSKKVEFPRISARFDFDYFDFDPTIPHRFTEQVSINFPKKDFDKAFESGIAKVYKMTKTNYPAKSYVLEPGPTIAERINKTFKKNSLYYDDVIVYDMVDLNQYKPGVINNSSPVLNITTLPEYKNLPFGDPRHFRNKENYELWGKQTFNEKVIFGMMTPPYFDNLLSFNLNEIESTLDLGDFSHINIDEKLTEVPLLNYQKTLSRIKQGYWSPYVLIQNYPPVYVPQDRLDITSISLHYMTYEDYLVPFYLLCGEGQKDEDEGFTASDFCGIMEAVDYEKNN